MEDLVKREKMSAAKRKVKEFNKARALVKATDDGKAGGTVASSASANSHTHLPMETHSHTANNAAIKHKQHLTNGTADLNENFLFAISDHQLSHQTNGYGKDNTSSLPSSEQNQHLQIDGVGDYELVNKPFTARAEECTKANDLLTQQLHDAKNEIQRLQHTLQSDHAAFDEKLRRELGSLKEQLQVHIQTIGILVAEKTELQSNLNQNQRSTEQLIGERDELSGRIKASRQRVEDLEKNMSLAVNKNQKLDKANKEMSKEVDRLKIDIFKLNKANDEFQQQISELHGKLNKKITENGKLVDEVKELKNAVEMSDLRMQQLQAGDSQDNQKMGQLTQTVAYLQQQLSQAMDTVNAVSADREQAVAQYQAYVEQMQIQSRKLQAQVNTLLDDKELLLAQRSELENTVAELQQRTTVVETEAIEALAAKQTLTETVANLSQDLEHVSQLYNALQADSEQQSRYVNELEATVEQQRDELQRFADTQVDHTKLLENMQNDKTSLSRATAQNRELKTQLAELQNGFIKMSNENMELLTKLQSEQHMIKELSSMLKEKETELEYFQHTHLSRSETEVPGSIGNISDSWSVAETVHGESSTVQNSVHSLSSVEHGHFSSSSSNDKQLELLSTAVKFLEQERSHLSFQWKNEQRLHQQTQKRVIDLQQQLESQAPAISNGLIVSRTQFDSLQHAMKLLEEKYIRIMRDKADLYDRLEASEHQLMLMQGQADTIGEYVSLYQTQRNALRQRQVLNDGHVVKISREREELQGKLRTLQSLVIRLLSEKQQYQQANVSDINSSVPLQLEASRGLDDPDAPRDQTDGDPDLRHASMSAVQEDYTSFDDDNGTLEDGCKQRLLDMHSSEVSNVNCTVSNVPSQDELIVDSITSEQADIAPSLTTDTAQQIMHLLQEMNQSSSDRPQVVTGVLQCTNCRGLVIEL